MRETARVSRGKKNGPLGRVPDRDQDEREPEGRSGDKFTNPMVHPIFTAALSLQQSGEIRMERHQKKNLFYGNRRSSSNHPTKTCLSTLLHLNLNGQSRIRHMRNMATWKKEIKMTSEETDNLIKLFIYLFGQAGS